MGDAPATPYRALLFDLFGTVIWFKPHVPSVTVGGVVRRSTMEWLREAAERELPGLPFETLLGALGAVTEDIVRARAPEYREVPSHERFRRALERVGVRGRAASAQAERLSLAHMAYLAACTEMPAEHGSLLRELSGAYRLGLVSNFDHAATARGLLSEHGIAELFAATLISAEFGRRKPHPAIFGAALRQLGARAAETLYIGDSVADDVCGARAAGIDVAWINAGGGALPAGSPEPTFVIRRLMDLPALLANGAPR